MSALASTGGVAYDWFKNGVQIPTATNATYTIAAVSAADAGSYCVVVRGDCNTVTNCAALTVNAAVALSDLSGVTVCPGTEAGFSATASGTGPFNYQWTLDGAVVGTNGPTLLTSTVNLSAGNHVVAVTVTGQCGAASHSATLTVQPASSASGPSDARVCRGGDLTLATVASGVGPFDYQWRLDGTATGSNGPNLTVPTAVLSLGDHSVTVEVSGRCGLTLTNQATLSVQDTLAVNGPAGVAVCREAEVSLVTEATGTGPFTYQWALDGSAVGTNGPTLTLSAGGLALGDHTVQVVVSGQCAGVVEMVTNSATLTVLPATAASGPSNSVRIAGQSAMFDTTASGAGPFTYQWRKDGADIPGATSPSFTVPSVSAGDAGSYCVVVSGACDNVTNCATLTVTGCVPVTSSTPQLNPQTGLFEQKVQVTNSTDLTFPAMRVSISGLRQGVEVYNVSGDEGGIPFVQYSQELAAGEVAVLTIEYYVADRQTPEATLCARSASTSSPVRRDGTAVTIDRTVRLVNGSFLIEFQAGLGRAYYIQYSQDMVAWKTVTPSVTSGANRIQWIDDGPPKTESLPTNGSSRFYRVITVP